jgi:hypothetical protein
MPPSGNILFKSAAVLHSTMCWTSKMSQQPPFLTCVPPLSVCFCLQAEPDAVAKLPANPDKSLAFVEVSVTLQPSKSAVKLGPMELLLPLAIKAAPPSTSASGRMCRWGAVCSGRPALHEEICVICVACRTSVQWSMQ